MRLRVSALRRCVNSTADVLHAATWFRSLPELAGAFTPLDTFALLVAALVHDLQHPGYSNSFAVMAMDPLALRYNDATVLENHHAASFFSLTLGTPGANILAGFPDTELRSLRTKIIQVRVCCRFSA